MTKLSVNINKVATIRNARGGNIPDVREAAIKCQLFGADGITVHPRPDERHIRYRDVYEIKEVITTEFNIEGYPCDNFLKLVLDVVPEQVTLVPDPPDVLTSCAGWDTKKAKIQLTEVISVLKKAGIRTSIFIDTDLDNIYHAVNTGTDRIELYTEPYAINFPKNPESAVKSFTSAAIYANELGLEINAGHDLDMKNLNWFVKNVPYLSEVSIGHAIISDALYYGLENTINIYKREILR